MNLEFSAQEITCFLTDIHEDDHGRLSVHRERLSPISDRVFGVGQGRTTHKSLMFQKGYDLYGSRSALKQFGSLHMVSGVQ